MTDFIAPEWWSEWSKSASNTGNVTLAEFGSTGAGSQGTRASFATKLQKAVVIEDILGATWKDEWWVDESYM